MNNGAEGIIDEISFWERVLDEKEIGEMMDVSLDVEPIGKLAVTVGRGPVPRHAAARVGEPSRSRCVFQCLSLAMLLRG